MRRALASARLVPRAASALNTLQSNVIAPLAGVQRWAPLAAAGTAGSAGAARPLSTGTQESGPRGSGFKAAAIAGIAAGLAAAYVWRPHALGDAPASKAPAAAQQAKQPEAPKLKEYTKEEVAKHRTPAERVWVTYKGEVFDITEFVANHPGGAGKIMLAAGGALEPFWAMYAQHSKPEVHKLLGRYKIGTLKGGAAAQEPVADPYQNEPSRHPALEVRTSKPFNAETPPAVLAAGLTTPNDLFYVRNHLPVPVVDPGSYALKIEGDGLRMNSFSLELLKRAFRQHTITATVQCSGNRRSEMKAVKEGIHGLDWTAGAISTATWTGVLLRDVLAFAGLHSVEDAAAAGVKHIQFEGLDGDMTGQRYGASIPVEKALDPNGDVLLAWEMNGQPLGPDHGAPLRVVVPGVTGARSVKWVGRIIASAHESPSFWQQRDYKVFSPGQGWDDIPWDSTPAIQESPVQSAICEPAPGTTIYRTDGEVTVAGYAYSGGGRGIQRVDVSLDGGKTWTVAQLTPPPQPYGRVWAWTLWRAEVPIPKEIAQDKKGAVKELEIVCKAVDSACNGQPDSALGIWNLRGLVNNAWHRVKVPLE